MNVHLLRPQTTSMLAEEGTEEEWLEMILGRWHIYSIAKIFKAKLRNLDAILQERGTTKTFQPFPGREWCFRN